MFSRPGSPRFDAPRPIFLGFTALTVVAGFGYYTVKQSNLEKKKAIMRDEDISRAREKGLSVTEIERKDEARRRAEERSQQNQTGEKSPIQSLLGQLSRQTSR